VFHQALVLVLGIGIGIGQYYWVLGTLLGIVLIVMLVVGLSRGICEIVKTVSCACVLFAYTAMIVAD